MSDAITGVPAATYSNTYSRPDVYTGDLVCIYCTQRDNKATISQLIATVLSNILFTQAGYKNSHR